MGMLDTPKCSYRRRVRATRPLAALLLGAALSVPTFSTSATRASDANDASDAQLAAAALAADTTTPELAQLQTKFRAVADRVAPSVVAICAAMSPGEADDAIAAQDINAQLLDAMLDGVTRMVGTGFVLDADGYIVTNEHVVAEARQIWVTTDDRKVYPAIVVGSDPRADLAVLKIPADKLTPVRFAPQPVTRGQWTIALGNPFGLAGAGEMSLSVGVVSATNRSLPKLSSRENRLYANLIQTTAQINPGNSGGPLFDLAGDVIGINTAVVMPQKQTNGIGFALPVDQCLLNKLRSLKDGREIVYGYLGVVVSNPTLRQRRDGGAKDAEPCVRVDSVEQNSPADTAGLRSGDLLLGIDNQPAGDSDQFVRMMGEMPVGHPATVRLIRNRKVMAVSVTPARRQQPGTPITHDLQRLRWRGIIVGPKPTTPNDELPGVKVFAVEPNSPFAKDGIVCGAVITALDGARVTDLFTFQRLINDTPADRCALTLAPATDNVATAK